MLDTLKVFRLLKSIGGDFFQKLMNSVGIQS